MDGESLLTSAIEVGIALAGFSGIVAVLGRRNQGSWSSAEKLRLQLLLQTSFSAVLFAMLPLFLLSMKITESSIWRLSSGIWLIYIVIEATMRIREISRIRAESAEPFPRAYFAFIASGLLLVTLFQLFNVVSLAEASPHLLAIIWSIIVAFLQFVRLLRGIWQA